MVTRTLNRRASLFAIGATLGVVGLLQFQSLRKPASTPKPELVSSTNENIFDKALRPLIPAIDAQSSNWPPPGWTAPTIWDSEPSGVRNVFLQLDMFVYVHEQIAVPSPTLNAAISLLMSDPAFLPLRRFVVAYVMDTDRNEYIIDLLQGLVPSAQSPIRIRRSILFTCWHQFRTLGPTAITPQIRSLLQFYRDSAIEPDMRTQEIVTDLVEMLLAAGI